MKTFSMKISLFAFLSAIFLFTPIGSQNIDLSQEWVLSDGIPFATDLETTIEDEVAGLANILGIVVIHNGKIVTEHYYNDSSVDDVYNIWSVSKSYASTLVGQAYDLGMIDHPDSSLIDFLPDYEIDYVSQITLDNLLSMSSGYNDLYGYPAWYAQSTATLLGMSYEGGPGYFFYNNSACHLNSHVIYYGTNQTPHEFASTHLFPYLGIENPQWNSGYLDINDGSASLHLKLREMVKLGQLYLQDGYSGDEQILSSEWIERATTYKVSTGWDQIPSYGYLWWLPNDESYLAFGFGGQYVLVVPHMDLVIGTHSTDWGPGNINEHQTNLLNALINKIVPLFNRPSVIINEILASNNGCCQDEHDEFDEYIELYNFGNDTIDVAGFFLTNEPENSDSYVQIQAAGDSTLIAPGEFLLLWSDDSPSQGILHLDALLSNTGGDLVLYAHDTATIADAVSYPFQAPDIAYARELDGQENWSYMDPTPGMSNTTIMATEKNTSHPESFKLRQNYPNPFNPTTNISFELFKDSDINIHIFDVSGKMVKDLVSGFHNTGSHTIQWNAKDENGKTLSAGLYLYAIQVGNIVYSKKMVLLK